MDVWVLPASLRERRERMPMVKNDEGQTEEGWSPVGPDPMAVNE